MHNEAFEQSNYRKRENVKSVSRNHKLPKNFKDFQLKSDIWHKHAEL